MKILQNSILLLVALLFMACGESSIDKGQVVNPIIGDLSFESKFGYKPDPSTDNQLRIKTHLEYVENVLRNKEVSGLSIELKNNREHLLDLLHDYWKKGEFPKNFDYADMRKPCFIDKNGAICAVGYLVEQTTSRETAEEINNKFKYNELLTMNDEGLNDWVSQSGFTKVELAMIQPTYGPTPIYTQDSYVSQAYGISSSVICGLNLSLGTVNGIQIAKGTKNKTIPIIGLFTGAGQIVLGATHYPKETYNPYGNYAYNVNEGRKTLSMLNIGLGTSTLVLSSWNLITNRRHKQKSTSWNIYTFPTEHNNNGLAFSMLKKF